MRNQINRAAVVAAFAACAATAASCGIEKQSAPPLAGPSEYGTSITMVADPNMVARDGVSTARVTLVARGPNSAPIANLPIALFLTPVNGGTLSAPQVVTDANGRAVFTYTAPSIDTLVDRVAIEATPFGQNFADTTFRRIDVALLAPGAATPAFSVLPATPQRFQAATFDASATTFGGTACNGLCTYTWTFGSESTATGQVVTYKFQQQQTYVVTLSVLSPTGITTTRQQSVAVTAATLPTAVITVSPTNPKENDVVSFSGAGSTAANGATITNWEWDFGNSVIKTGVSVTHQFTDDRTYVVRLTVTDSNGLTATSTATVTVAAP